MRRFGVLGIAADLLLCLACGASDDAPEPAASANALEAPVVDNGRVAPADVTVLAPLPGPDGLDAMLGPTGLLPDAEATPIGQLVEQFAPEDTRARLRVVCTRFDPCAPKPGGDAHACIGEVRLVLQPLLVTDGAVGAQDAAVHVFYDLDAGATRDLAARLAAMPGAGVNGGQAEPLGVSTRLEGKDPTYGAALRALVVDLTSKAELSRVTFLRNVDVKGNGWTFGGFDVHGGIPTPLTVPRVGGSQQGVIVNGSWPFATSLAPAPSGEDTLGLLLDPTRLGILADANEATAKARVTTGFAAALALEDPARHDASTADCASCHVAGGAREFAREFAAQHGFGPLPGDDGASATPNADAGTPAVTAAQTLRACGYVGTKPVVSQRTVNESALAARRMGALVP